MRNEQVWERMWETMDLTDEVGPGQPIIELCGCKRVVIERHMGIKTYTRDQISVKVRFGVVDICGQGLQICRMSKDRLLIQGTIDAVTLMRRN